MTAIRHVGQHGHDRQRTDGDASSWREHHSTYDPRYGAHMVRVLPGDYYTTGAEGEIIVTVLGSCVAACLRDPRTGFGGMNHFMLPESSSGDWNGLNASTRYGNYAMEALINEVLKTGCARSELEIKLFGGANVAAGQTSVGRKNIEFVLRYVKDEGLRILAQDLGGAYGRRIHYVPSTGKVRRTLLKRTSNVAVVEAERQYGLKLRDAPVEGAIELFD